MSHRARLAGVTIIAAAALAALLSSPPVAAADGLPVVGINARPLSAPASDVAYVTRRAGRRTVLERIDADSERRLRRVLLPGTLAVPAIAYDATPSGITPDGRKLVLIEPRRTFPRARTRFALIDTRSLGIRRIVRLRGDFSFDAISPDGRTMYVIRYPSRDPQRYEVRAYDLRAGRLLPEPIVDPREPDERMNGQPVTRVTGPGGRWEYTLYDGGEHPFVHALDTERGRAFCVDLELPRGGLWGARLALSSGGDTLRIVMGAKRLASIDTRTFEVSGIQAPPARHPARETGSGVPWALVALPTLLLLAAAGLLTARLGRQRQLVLRTLGRARDAAGRALERTR